MVSDTHALPVRAETVAAIDAEMARYPESRGALLYALRRVQDELGHISADTARAVAQHFGLRSIEVLELVSFYDGFHDAPRGRHEVAVCTSLSCALRGAAAVLAAVETKLGVPAGATSPDGRVHLLHAECQGACDGAPMMRVDGEPHADVDAERACRLIDELA